MYLQPERYKIKVRKIRFTCLMFSGAKIQRRAITYPLEFTWITAKKSNKLHLGKCLCQSEMLLVDLLMLFQPERILK